MQNNITITDNTISGVLKQLSTGEIVDRFGKGNFIALKFSGLPANVNPRDIQVGIEDNLTPLDENLNGV